MSTSKASEYDVDLPDDTSEATPIFGTIMGLWFLALGVGAAYFAVTRYLAGWPFLSVQVLGLLGVAALMFIAVGGVA